MKYRHTLSRLFQSRQSLKVLAGVVAISSATPALLGYEGLGVVLFSGPIILIAVAILLYGHVFAGDRSGYGTSNAEQNPSGLLQKPNSQPSIALRLAAIGCLTPIAGLILFVGILWVSPRTASRPLEDKKIEAWTASQHFVNSRLKSPATADYGGVFSPDVQDPRSCVEALGGGEYRVNGWVDSQNGFGAKLRTHFSLRVKESQSNGNWSLIGDPVLQTR